MSKDLNVQVEWSGLNELRVGLNKRANMSLVKETVRKSGADLQRAMVRKAVFTRGYSKGDTSRSIELAMWQSDLTAVVAPGTHYASYLEYGTRFMSAQPFVGPAFNEVAPQFKSALERIMK